MFNLGFGGQFGGGFLQAPGSGVVAPEGGGVVVYAVNTSRAQPRDRSGRRPAYERVDDTNFLQFPVGTGQQDPEDSWKVNFPVGPIWFHKTAYRRDRRYR